MSLKDDINIGEGYAVKRSDGDWRSAEVIQTRGSQVLNIFQNRSMLN